MIINFTNTWVLGSVGGYWWCIPKGHGQTQVKGERKHQQVTSKAKKKHGSAAPAAFLGSKTRKNKKQLNN